MTHDLYLSKMPAKLRAKIESEPVYATWLRRGETLETIWKNPDLMETVYNRLSDREKKVLLLIAARFGCEPFDGAALERQAWPCMSGAEAKVGLVLLLHKGLVYMFRKAWGEHVYGMAADALGGWQRRLPGGDEELPQRLRDGDIQLTNEGGESLRSRLFRTLVLLGGNEFRLTQNGTLYKKHQQKWEAAIGLADEPFEYSGLSYANADVYPPRLAVMMELLCRLRLVEQRGETLGLRESAVRRWLAMSVAGQNRLLYRIWKTAAFPDVSWLQHAALRLERQPEGEWLRAADLIRRLRGWGVLTSADNEPDEALIDRFERRWLRPLQAFGWLEAGLDAAEGLPAYRWRTHPLVPAVAPDPDARFYVQPDFEVLVPPDVPYSVRWDLSGIAEQKGADTVSVYKLSKESLQRSLDNGWSLAASLGFLERHAFYGVPDNVRLTLEQWAKPSGKVRSARELELRGHETVAAEEKGKNELRLFPDQLVGEPDASMEPLAEKGFLYDRNPFVHLEMEHSIPDIGELYPQLNALPPGWIKDYRVYHVSTRREMVEKALEWKTALQVRRNGTDLTVVPRMLQETEGTWSVTVLELAELREICLFPGEWQEMKMLLPGLYEK